MKNKIFYYFLTIVSSIIIVYFLFFTNNIIYKQDIYVNVDYSNCKTDKKEYDLKALHLPYNNFIYYGDEIDIIFDNKKIGEIKINKNRKTINYKNFMGKENHYETLFTDKHYNYIFFYPEQYNDLAKIIKEEKKEIEIKFLFNKGIIKEKSFIINTEKYNNLIFNKDSRPTLEIDTLKNQVKVKTYYEGNYKLLVQKKNGKIEYNEKIYECKKNKCDEFSNLINVEENDDYLGVLVFNQENDKTFEYKIELFESKEEKKCIFK